MMSTFDLDKLINATMDISMEVSHSYWGVVQSSLPDKATHEHFSNELTKTYRESVSRFVSLHESDLHEFLDLYNDENTNAEWFLADCLAWSCFPGGEGFNMGMKPVCHTLMTAASNAGLPDPARLDWRSTGDSPLDGEVVLMTQDWFIDQ